MEEKPDYARRMRRDENSPTFLDDPVVQDMLVRLDQLERQTDHLQTDSENGKDALANKALRIASELSAYVAGWAMDHKIGLAIDGLGNIPELTLPRRTPAYNDLRRLADNHKHETAGCQTTDLDDRTKRKALSNQFKAVSRGLNKSLLDSLAEAMEALEYGETLPILAPVRDGRKRKFRELTLQLWALCYIEYRGVLGDVKHQLQLHVSEAFGVSEPTVRGWERQLPKQFDAYSAERAISRAQLCGEFDRDKGNKVFDEAWGTTALSEQGALYKAIQGFKKL